MNGDRLSFTNRQLYTMILPRWKCSFFARMPHSARRRGSCWAESHLPPCLPKHTQSHGRGMLLSHRSCFSRNTSLLCPDIVTANLPATSCVPHVFYTSLSLVVLELACYLVLLYEGARNWFDFQGSYFKMNRDEKYFIKSEKSGSCSPYPCSLSIPLALNRLESSG